MFLDDAMLAGQFAAEEREKLVSAAALEQMLDEAPARPSFGDAIARRDGGVRIVAEVKRMSPSAGDIRSAASIGETAASYERAGASAVSILTSEFGFGGRVGDLDEASASCGLPLLCKDFISIPYQVLEARAHGASAVLLIAEALEDDAARDLISLTHELGMDALVEAHTVDGLARAIEVGARVIGINNRNLETLEVDISTTERLRDFIPRVTVVVSESGIRTKEDAARMTATGVDALLIGEALMRAPEPGMRLSEITGR